MKAVAVPRCTMTLCPLLYLVVVSRHESAASRNQRKLGVFTHRVNAIQRRRVGDIFV
jgi:hypothetical protein